MTEPATAWQTAKVVAVKTQTARVKTLRLQLTVPVRHRAGQHFVLRLTAPDGYVASRSYSVASPPDGSGRIELTIEHLDDGEVSTFVHEVVEVGDELEVRGPIGGYFVWDGAAPALLVGGGSGVVPLMSMLRLARNEGNAQLLRLVVSVRTPADLFYPDEIGGPETTIIYTRAAPPGDARPVGRLGAADLRPVARPDLDVYVCGSAGFADAVTDTLLELDVPAARIRVERFGPTA